MTGGGGPMKKVLVLIVEDDPSIADFLISCLQSGGYQVELACGGLQGCRKAVSMRPALVILDLLMPDMHGFDVCQTLRGEESLSGLKILISTAKAYPTDRRAIERLGADGFLSKPYTHAQLMAAVKELVGEAAPHD